ncbi:sulfite exporter TauE/SafE family protein [Desulfolutivibrio sulfoxidireducens]|uniref:sulfite exporter TauE/SafE family protein n=1 Tax=Desulfolutivibrio sulfoxidireducens TaxID=2773299 RepID=UPI00159D8930|nr:sulfite exporter TauE/SafE family protein [Desulfolutivibrio sulfoxidireducens]QLA15673.1 TSUP family transporter [Desulfolutivibrio sulfoxidireducens]QLA19279.1 TSUP family transporter [Desulfolutivibrio sulfoxidireducens]
MGLGRNVFEFLKSASIAHAKWDMEVSMSIVRNRKKMLFLLILALPILAVSFVEAGDMIGGKTAYAPAFYTTTIFLVSIAVGLAAGLITGCIGAGGGFIITPALMAAGVKGILAVGTDLFHIFAKAIMGTAVHRKLGNVSVKLAIAFLVGSGGGTFIGGAINKGLYNKDPLLSELFISVIYAILLGFLGFYALFDFLKSSRAQTAQGGGGHDAHGGPSGTTGLAVKLQNMKIPPMITFDEDFVPGGKRISGWIVAGGGVVVGILAAIMGVGGGFVTFPMFVYIFGVSSMTTVGTDILQIIFTAGLGAIAQYAIYGFVFYTLAMGMLLGSLLGIQIGALTTKVVKGIHIRGFYAMSIIAGFINRAAVLPKKLVELEYIEMSKPMVNNIEFVGNIVFWIVVAIFGIWVIGKFVTNISTLRQEA